jgi:hypothetical protein
MKMLKENLNSVQVKKADGLPADWSRWLVTETVIRANRSSLEKNN